VTEAEWLTRADPIPMLEFLRHRVFERQLRLFACGCCRRLWPILPTAVKAVVPIVEEDADGQVTHAQYSVFVIAHAGQAPEGHARLLRGLAYFPGNVWHPDCMRAVREVALACAAFELRSPSARRNAAQADTLRDIFGNPFRTVAFRPEWRTDTAVALAEQMYESREFSAMPILADALQDAGCENTDVLAHCREAGPHVRGCWVVDLVLGKE
jgi:hypothetical protein